MRSANDEAAVLRNRSTGRKAAIIMGIVSKKPYTVLPIHILCIFGKTKNILQMKSLYIIAIVLLPLNISAQTVKIQCTQKEKKNDEGKDPILIKTCYYKTFKFVITSYPDYVGRYFYSEHEVFVRSKDKYIKTTNDRIFNKTQKELVYLINERIKQDFDEFKSDSITRDCLTEIDSIPVYKMNDFDISFEGNEIWFEVHWDLISACRAVDGTIVTFKLNEIKKYLN